MKGKPGRKLHRKRALPKLAARGFCALKSGRTTREKTSPTEEFMPKGTKFCGRCLLGETGLKNAITRQPHFMRDWFICFTFHCHRFVNIKDNWYDFLLFVADLYLCQYSWRQAYLPYEFGKFLTFYISCRWKVVFVL